MYISVTAKYTAKKINITFIRDAWNIRDTDQTISVMLEKSVNQHWQWALEGIL